MGFTDPDDPVTDLITFIKKGINIEVTNPKFSKIVGVTYTIHFPTYSEFREGLDVKLDRWNAGESWVEMLELGLVSGVPRFLQSPPASTENSYSLLGIQVLKQVRGGTETLPKMEYISEIFSNARKFGITSKS